MNILSILCRWFGHKWKRPVIAGVKADFKTCKRCLITRDIVKRKPKI